ncbi:MAG TPA: tripartite tricarboxylate transporter substrate-binding protein [Burkholderiales bacterium]|nr:tripartite tricarboxylate transporter substrate-binding protein [Burkholderiales bacterium]
MVTGSFVKRALRFTAWCWVCAALLSAEVSMAQAYPNRPVRLIAPYGAGGSYDLIARIVAQKLGEQMGQQVIVDNRPGAAGRIGMETAVKAAPDGYTLMTIGNSQVIVPIVYGKAPYDLARDITPITTTATITNTLIVNPALPARSVTELVALSKSKPQTIRFGSGGTGGITHLMGEYFKSMSAADITHVPYKAGIMSVNATLGGEIEMIFLNAFQAAPLIQSGKLRGLAVTSLQRSRFLPSLPTLDESGLKGYEVLEFHSVAAPRGLPADVLKRLHSEIAQAVSSRDVTDKLTQQAAEGSVRSPEQLRQFIKTEHDKYEQIVKTVGIKPE